MAMAEVSGMILVLLHHIRRSYYAISMATHPIEVSALGWNFHLGITFIAIQLGTGSQANDLDDIKVPRVARLLIC